MVAALRYVSTVFLCRDSLDALEIVKPTVFCKGADYLTKGLLNEEEEFCAKHGVEIAHTKFNPQTTSGIIERIRCA